MLYPSSVSIYARACRGTQASSDAHDSWRSLSVSDSQLPNVTALGFS